MAEHYYNLLPCPFCGCDQHSPVESVVHLSGTGESDDPDYTVQCDGCSATMGCSWTEEEAVAAWNRRATPKSVAAAPESAQAVAWRQLVPVGSMYAWSRWFGVDEPVPEEAYRVEYAYAAPPSLGGEDAALREYAERYRWLRDESHNGAGMSPAVILAEADFPVDDNRTDGFVFGDELDAAIDAARAAEGGKP